MEEEREESPINYAPSQGESLIAQHNNESTMVRLIQQLEVYRRKGINQILEVKQENEQREAKELAKEQASIKVRKRRSPSSKESIVEGEEGIIIEVIEGTIQHQGDYHC